MSFTHDAIVIGAGAAGLTAAGGMAMFGLKVALIEAGEMGGECLNTGCVPSKALIAAAARAHQARLGARLGIRIGDPEVSWTGVMDHVQRAIAQIAPHDAQERFEAMGVEVIRARAELLGNAAVRAGNRTLVAPRLVIATGSRPAIPPIEGMETVPFLTNESLFALEGQPHHLLVLGGGAVGMEMAQAFRRLGSEVTLVEADRPLASEDEEAARLIVAQAEQEGVRIVLAQVKQASRRGRGVMLLCSDGTEIAGSHLLVATGRRANLDGLGLKAAGVEAGSEGIRIDQRRRTSNSRIYAIGDCRDGPRLTHAAGYEGSLVALEIALGLRSPANFSALPRCVFTDPELAQVGLTETEARKMYRDVRVIREEFSDNDRAVAEGEVKGFLKLVLKGRKVLGVTIVGSGAGELLLPWSQVITGRSSTFSLASAVVAYPTRSEISKAAGFSAWEPLIFGRWPKRWAGLLAKGRKWRR